MIRSMTGFASARGEKAPFSWSWDLRSVNAKGLDLRLRVPDWLEGLEAALRADLAKALTRGSVNLTLRLGRDEEVPSLALNQTALAAVLDALAEAEEQAMARGLTLAPSCAADLLALRGVMDAGSGEEDLAPVIVQLKAEFEPLVQAFVQMRETEGAALSEILQSQLARVEELTAEASELAEARKGAVAETLRANLARVLANSDGADPDRVAQELALLAVKADVTEELDRLRAHVRAARALLDQGGAVGRKLDFLMQEFNREANTLCSKSQNADLTAVGLELKAVIDQMREQVQNVE
ncbi:YicC/YloC family endoribonuclease [Ruegeria marina]|uniref:TIGR00255 family protein n=1 Tax=Ruegeria marina TaxID=639004 RepID=A0A1G6ILS4_9RHOB|nr:YicC/YloC family endoribonuclease [Ruegeria marina]SDC06716.1 TIGR00255 family protein [Ruegeria marina]